MNGPWRIELLGGLRVGCGEQAPTPLPRQKPTALLAYLAYFAHHPHPREALIELLWPEVDPETGRLNLRVAIHTLRRLLAERGPAAGELVIARRATVHLEPSTFTTDAAEFRAALQAAAATEALRPRAERLSTATALYGGELLPGSFEPWVLTEREHLAGLYLEALQQLVRTREELGDLSGALAAARQAILADPLREEAHYDVMRLYAATGQPSACLQQYQELERVLREELGETPSAEARALAEELQQNARRLVVARRAPGRGDGETGRPGDGQTGGVEVCSVALFPLPVPLTRFFGREEEIAQLTELLSSPFTRLVTVTGSGGSGKTRLAIAVAARLQERFGEAVTFVPLADLTDPLRLMETIAAALGLTRAPEIEPLEQVVEHLRRQPWLLVLDNFEQLVAGPLSEAEGGAIQIRAPLERVPTLTCLVTSRQRLGIGGEQEFALLPLPTPRSGVQAFRGRRPEGVVPGVQGDKVENGARVDFAGPERLNALLQFPSVQLFVDRARAVRPDFQVTEANAGAIASLCDRLEGLPLALELAAARTRLLTPEQILSRLTSRFELLESRQRDLPARHRSLRAAMEWSYQLLTPELQCFFARLSVFRGGWTLEAAEAVCGEEGVPAFGRSGVQVRQNQDQAVLVGPERRNARTPERLAPALDCLEQLQASSLIVTEEAARGASLRYRFLETVREFAVERLPEEEREALAGRHAVYLMSLAETAEPHLEGPEHAIWLDRLEAEQDNFRAALDWCVESGVQAFGRSGVQEYFVFRSSCSTEAGPPLTLPDTKHALRTTPVEIGLRIGAALAPFWLIRGYLAEGRTRLQALLAAEEQARCQSPVDDAASRPLRRSCVRAQAGLGTLAVHHGDYDAARPLLEASLSAARALEDPSLIAASLLSLGVVGERTDDHPRAAALIEEAVAIYRELGNERAVATCLTTLADMARHQPDHEPARALYRQACSIYRALGEPRGTGWALTRLGNLAVGDGRLEEARADHQEALALFREVEDRIGIAATLNFLGEVALPRHELAQARQLFEESLAIWRELDSRRDIIWSLRGLASVALAESNFGTARACLEEALALARRLGPPVGDSRWLQALNLEVPAKPGWEAARDCFRVCVEFVREMGAPDIAILVLEALGHRAREDGDDEIARRFYRESLLMRRALAQPYALAQSLEQFALLACRKRHPNSTRQAIRLLGAAERFCEPLGARPPVAVAKEYERMVAEARAALGEAAFAEAWAEGRAMSLDQALDYALLAPQDPAPS